MAFTACSSQLAASIATVKHGSHLLHIFSLLKEFAPHVQCSQTSLPLLLLFPTTLIFFLSATPLCRSLLAVPKFPVGDISRFRRRLDMSRQALTAGARLALFFGPLPIARGVFFHVFIPSADPTFAPKPLSHFDNRLLPSSSC